MTKAFTSIEVRNKTYLKSSTSIKQIGIKLSKTTPNWATVFSIKNQQKSYTLKMLYKSINPRLGDVFEGKKVMNQLKESRQALCKACVALFNPSSRKLTNKTWEQRLCLFARAKFLGPTIFGYFKRRSSHKREDMCDIWHLLRIISWTMQKRKKKWKNMALKHSKRVPFLLRKPHRKG